MNISRQKFTITTDTGGDLTDTGPVFSGLVLQVALTATTLDTGCDLRLELVNSGVVIADWDNIGGTTWAKSPRITTFDTGGSEIGDSPFVSALDKIRLTVTQSAAVTGSKTATLYVWTGS